MVYGRIPTVGVQFPKIEIDHEKCTVPFWCKKCLQVCPGMVFSVNQQNEERLRENDPRLPGTYRLTPVRRDKCSVCLLCIEACPVNAIKIAYLVETYQGVEKEKVDLAELAQKDPYPVFMAPRPYSFELVDDIIKLLEDEFGFEKVTAKFAEAIANKSKGEIETIGKKFWQDYGRDWMQKTYQIGEEYPDRTYEVLLETADRTGGYGLFPHAPQRFIETAYLSCMGVFALPIIENNQYRLIYKMPDCPTFKAISEKAGGEVASLLLCSHGCLTAAETILRDLNIDALVEMEGTMPKDGFCQFAIRRG
jgi:ferredoxin